ncbi:MAG: hypothetical protein BGP10_13245 [Rhodanobacter sp. 68-29]|nr:hypothetical protein [Rhodanobacter sp.]ODU92208.1 MAG: hypothetical protein ABT18_13090 [Rhodanobacter sp. SCN 66-43]OJY58290.1 MAG: hypothetical protein BGP10_13245 [Rhodanobacter sp. 68-29]
MSISITSRVLSFLGCLAIGSPESDDSPLINIGQTIGKLAHRGDRFAADEGLLMSISLRDLSTHMIIFGETNSGMTSSQLRPKIAGRRRRRIHGKSRDSWAKDQSARLDAFFKKKH